MSINAASARSPAIHAWIIACLALVALMVFIGGVTRLTESGLSIVEWKLLSGILPPMSEQGWEAELQAYRQTPEYQQINRGMNISEFKQIFWLEYIHRLLGRVIGLAIALPFFYFLLRRQMDKPLTVRMFAACLLVGAQGAVGWIMVKSGLVDDPRVSPVKLALHLSLAFIFWSLLFWTLLQLRQTPRRTPEKTPAVFIRIILLLLAAQIIMGAFVAGMDAGLTYNTYPLMDGTWIPDGLWALEPTHRNLVENITMVQFQHRWMAVIVSIAMISFIICAWKQPDAPRRLLAATSITLLMQFTLGVLTLIHVVPLALASAHQMAALLLLSLILMLCYRYPCKTATAQA